MLRRIVEKLASISPFPVARSEHRVLMLGLGGAGKTLLLNRLMKTQNGLENERAQARETSGFNVESLDMQLEHTDRRFACVLWDVAGNSELWRRTWPHYYENTDALVFVICGQEYDVGGESSLQLAGQALSGVLENHMFADAKDNAEKSYPGRGLPVLVVVTRQDLSGALTPAQVAAELDLAERFEAAGIRCWRCVGLALENNGDDSGPYFGPGDQREVNRKTWETFKWVGKALEAADGEGPEVGVEGEATLVKSARKRGAPVDGKEDIAKGT